MHFIVERNALVITPTIVSLNLRRCMKSVRDQTHHTHHLIVTDGIDDVSEESYHILKQKYGYPKAEINLPWNVGKDGGDWYGHRVYATIPKLIPEKYDYIFFLDEDNFFEPEHVETCVKTMEDDKLDWCHSLRRIVDKDGKFLINDDCESLGKWPIYGQPGHHLVDTSSFCFKRDFIRQACPHWDHGWGGDRRFLSIISPTTKWDCSGKYTLNYRLDGNPNSVTEQFFIEGNKKTDQKRPWRN